MADAFYRLHACTDAKGALDALVKRKPSKTLEERAKQLTKAIKESPKASVRADPALPVSVPLTWSSFDSSHLALDRFALRGRRN